MIDICLQIELLDIVVNVSLNSNIAYPIIGTKQFSRITIQIEIKMIKKGEYDI